MRDLKADNRALIYISHRMDEIYELCNTCTIFRDGRKIASHPNLAEVPRDTLVQEMVGREISDIYDYKPRKLGDVRFAVTNIEGHALHEPTSFEVRRGEIVGFFGLVGAGRSELMHLVYGADRKKAGTITLDGEPIKIRSAGESDQARHRAVSRGPQGRGHRGHGFGVREHQYLVPPALPARRAVPGSQERSRNGRAFHPIAEDQDAEPQAENSLSLGQQSAKNHSVALARGAGTESRDPR